MIIILIYNKKYTKFGNLQKMFRERNKIQSRSERILYIL